MRFLSGAGRWAANLPHHIARKKIPYVDLETGVKTKPDVPNGIKLEQFVFDVFDLVALRKFGLFEVDRREEFSPLKNGAGSKEDNAETSRRDVLLQGRRWVEDAGGVVLDDGDKDAGLEISPLVQIFCDCVDFRFLMLVRDWSLCRGRRSRLLLLSWTRGSSRSYQSKWDIFEIGKCMLKIKDSCWSSQF
jgi:hypothetical protein